MQRMQACLHFIQYISLLLSFRLPLISLSRNSTLKPWSTQVYFAIWTPVSLSLWTGVCASRKLSQYLIDTGICTHFKTRPKRDVMCLNTIAPGCLEGQPSPNDRSKYNEVENSQNSNIQGQ